VAEVVVVGGEAVEAIEAQSGVVVEGEEVDEEDHLCLLVR